MQWGNCGEKKEKEEQFDNSAETSETTAEEVTSANEKTVVPITITKDDSRKFKLEKIKVKSRQTGRNTFKYVGKMDKNVMGSQLDFVNKC